MKRLVLETKTGFSSLLPFSIYDSKGIMFYSDKFTTVIAEGKRLFFNLPRGEYLIKGFIQKLSAPVENENIQLPKPERFKPLKKYRIIYKKNPNKCTIYYNAGIIVFDTSFKNYPKFIRDNIYFHEMGHHIYKSEELADLFAAKKMLDKGYNKSQVGLTSLLALSEKQNYRKNFIFEKLKNNK